MRRAGLVVTAIAAALACARTPEPAAPATIPRAEAVRLACEAIGERPPADDPFLHATLLRDRGLDAWRWQVDRSDPLGGGWSVLLDARTGEVLEKRRLPAR
jgi:hypothetical protein